MSVYKKFIEDVASAYSQGVDVDSLESLARAPCLEDASRELLKSFTPEQWARELGGIKSVMGMNDQEQDVSKEICFRALAALEVAARELDGASVHFSRTNVEVGKAIVLSVQSIRSEIDFLKEIAAIYSKS